ncbi:MAG: HypC/HybG/HupF family hydrogenase formation chaperone [Lachnospiraceae bacterium]|nr:HypC/HybG/HupF family hydrogenase formation chaperone [Lachnospiraceae bacterium]
MCVAIPGTVIEKKDHTATVDFGGTKVDAEAGLVEVREGDRVLVHAGCIIQKLDQKEANAMTALFQELEDALAEEEEEEGRLNAL